MIRKLNFTGRKSIPHEKFLINVRRIGGKRAFNAEIDFNGLGFPGNSRVYIEPYYKSSFMRFDFGTIENFNPPIVAFLSELPETDHLLFRIKIVDQKGLNGKLLGLADRVKPSSEDMETIGRSAILPVDFEKDLGHQVFNLFFDETGDRVILEINSKLENGPEFLRSNEFKSLVLPGIVRLIAERLKDHDYDSESGGWEDLWLKFFYTKLNIEEKPVYNEEDQGQMDDWIENLVSLFCRKNDVYQNFLGIKFN
jgi:hypothetical protein